MIDAQLYLIDQLHNKMCVINKMSTSTADGLYSYSQVIKGKSLLNHAKCLNEYLERLNDWPRRSYDIEEGRWGTDINISRIAYTLDRMKYCNSSMEALVHEGWAKCYMFWYMNTPWKVDPRFKRPNKSLQSRGKYNRALTNYDNLDRYQKAINEQIVNYIQLYCIE